MPLRKQVVSRKFSTAIERVRWAQQDIVNFKKLTLSFFSSQVYERLAEVDADDSHIIDKIRFKRRLHPDFTKLAVSALENLRAALDHGACAVVPRGKRGNVYFPFGRTRRELEDNIKSKSKNVPDEIKVLFRGFKPYRRGNPPLWALNKFCNTHKHRTIVRPGVHIKNAEFVGFTKGSGPNAIFRYSSPVWNRRKNEVIISRSPRQATSHHDIDISIGVAFGNVPVFSGRLVLAVLRYLARQVEIILWRMESEARKIGIVK